MERTGAMICGSCALPFTAAQRARVQCINQKCTFPVCRDCFIRYIESKNDDPSCMSCRVVLPMDVLVAVCGKNYVRTKYRAQRKALLLERALARLPEAMGAVQTQQHKDTLSSELKEVNAAMKKLREKKEKLTSALNDNSQRPTREIFTMACQKPNCRGFLNSRYRCGLCSEYTCSKCLVVLGVSPANHVCEQGALDTTELIRKTTRACPSCGISVVRTEGCDQMWCVMCHTAFSWRTGKRDTGTVHNPHYIEFARANGGADVIQNGVPCGGPPRRLLELLRKLSLERSITPDAIEAIDFVREAHYRIAHVALAAREEIATRIALLEDTEPVRVDYLLGKTTKARMATRLAQRDNERACLVEVGHLADLISTVGIERLHALYTELRERSHLQPVLQAAKEFKALGDYVRACKTKFSDTYQIGIRYL